MAVDDVRAQLTQHGEDRICVSEGQLFDEVVLLGVAVALRCRSVLVSVETPGVLRQGAVMPWSLCRLDPPDRACPDRSAMVIRWAVTATVPRRPSAARLRKSHSAANS